MKRDNAVDKGQDYTCANCGGEFVAVSGAEEQLAEMDELFTTRPGEELVVVCDDCWLAMGLGTALDAARSDPKGSA